MGNKNNWDADAMKGTLISDMENEVLEGIRKTNTDGHGGEKHQPSDITSEQEPTKGVQTYIPMEDYSRLMTIKLKRDADAKQKLQPRITIASLAAQAIELWLDVQEGKRKVEKL